MLLPFYREGLQEAGCDEAGRGCLAGPVVAAAVVLPPDFVHPGLDDSKKLNRKKRNQLKEIICDVAVEYGIGIVDNEEIDEINILNASFMAMHRALDQLNPESFNYILVDGNRFLPFKTYSHACIVKGDGLYMSIAAASILAKTHRDDIMAEYGLKYPQYGWQQNAGYPTRSHREAIKAHGITEYHRRSFRLLNEQLEIFDFQ